ncbi:MULTISPECIES: hypothetical protein [unclassified Mesorhizobium]|uniref:hypothetical protein n=1 Tax=unclassified Mesorhizobium TaxID=325217 RepID=UPI0013DF3331|nr:MULTISPECIES: hypothetical protein [unclassified Mesorhizobium]
MVRVVKATTVYAAIPERMTIIEPPFAWLKELATVPRRSHAAETIRTYWKTSA